MNSNLILKIKKIPNICIKHCLFDINKPLANEKVNLLNPGFNYKLLEEKNLQLTKNQKQELKQAMVDFWGG